MDKKKTKVIRNETERVVVDYETGEIIEQSKTSTHAVEKEPDFVKLYLSDIGTMMGLAPADQKVFMSLARHMSYNNMVVLIKAVKEQICKELDLSLNTINKSIDNLKKADLLIKYTDSEGNEKKSCWVVNPYFVAKGKWEDIRSIRLQIDYTNEGKKVKVIKNPNSTITVIAEDAIAEEITNQEPISELPQLPFAD